jgi:hypothetical protein
MWTTPDSARRTSLCLMELMGKLALPMWMRPSACNTWSQG